MHYALRLPSLIISLICCASLGNHSDMTPLIIIESAMCIHAWCMQRYTMAHRQTLDQITSIIRTFYTPFHFIVRT
ncbi:uncharacterized protein F5891DRAFT_1025880 [Suillus fuscotomentosus]|uniref:Secreted protein n=1 Tax=Suillus fuscotomentosus TaxID=1912939 RepID=A0AAD4HMB4_9AGAM|nr:uncharacterized protein F5891DRAFT_1025880 [Suillus fuscotomentosus]KAG1901873.1 hypothetical protein F5891DRAFT_1025880 [Suillus fuscotomentosus]